jgi:hypothetical protein
MPHDHRRFRNKKIRVPPVLMKKRLEAGLVCTFCMEKPYALSSLFIARETNVQLCLDCKFAYTDFDTHLLYGPVRDIFDMWFDSTYKESMTPKEFIDKMWSGVV